MKNSLAETRQNLAQATTQWKLVLAKTRPAGGPVIISRDQLRDDIAAVTGNHINTDRVMTRIDAYVTTLTDAAFAAGRHAEAHDAITAQLASQLSVTSLTDVAPHEPQEATETSAAAGTGGRKGAAPARRTGRPSATRRAAK